MPWESRWLFRALLCDESGDQPENVRRVLGITGPEGPRCGFPQPSKQGLVCAPDFPQPLAAAKCFQYRPRKFQRALPGNHGLLETRARKRLCKQLLGAVMQPGARAIPPWSLRQGPRSNSGHRRAGYDRLARISGTDESGPFENALDKIRVRAYTRGVSDRGSPRVGPAARNRMGKVRNQQEA